MKKILVVILSIASSYVGNAQDILFANPVQTLLKTNPSFAGSAGAMRGQVTVMDQWPSLPGRLLATYGGVDTYVEKLHGGIAISGLYSDFGRSMFGTSELNVTYAPVFELRNKQIKLTPSLQAGYLQVRDESLLKCATPFAGKASKQNLDLSAGLLMNYRNFYFGLSCFHLTQPDMGLYGPSQLKSRLTFNASYNFMLNSESLLNLGIVAGRQDSYQFANFSGNLILQKRYLLGVGYISGDAAYCTAGYRAKQFSISGGYNFTVSKLAGNTQGAYILSFGMNLSKEQDKPLKAFEAQ